MSGYDEALLKRARALHDAPNVTMDGHNDLPWALHDAYDHRLAKFDLREPQVRRGVRTIASIDASRRWRAGRVDIRPPRRHRRDRVSRTGTHQNPEAAPPVPAHGLPALQEGRPDGAVLVRVCPDDY